jgi:hypothetical protein
LPPYESYGELWALKVKNFTPWENAARKGQSHKVDALIGSTTRRSFEADPLENMTAVQPT